MEVGQTLAGGIQYNDGVFGAAALDSFGSATNRDIDWFSVSLKAGETYSVEVDAAAEGDVARPMFEVVNAQSALVARGDGKDSGKLAKSAHC